MTSLDNSRALQHFTGWSWEVAIPANDLAGNSCSILHGERYRSDPVKAGRCYVDCHRPDRICGRRGEFCLSGRTGNPLWHFNVGQLIHASAMSYEIRNKQYFAVAAGSDVSRLLSVRTNPGARGLLFACTRHSDAARKYDANEMRNWDMGAYAATNLSTFRMFRDAQDVAIGVLEPCNSRSCGRGPDPGGILF